ncbi:serine/threonine protein kinase [bacterium]|nr:serine/threonine protein kinase [bacterium]
MNGLPDDRPTQAEFEPSSDRPTTSDGPSAGSTPSFRKEDTDQLGKSLAAINLITSEDFRTVADIHQHNSFKILDDLERKGFITSYQRARLAEGHGETLIMDEYVILDRIGIGGMGEVFKARNRSLDRMEAIKTMNQGHDPSSSVSQRFHREAKMLARIEHPSIVPIYKVGHAQGVDYIAMKFIDGVNLKDKIDQSLAMGQSITVRQAVEWVSQAAAALAKAHEESIIHRDIKPSNLMVTPEGRLYILDLGIARLALSTSSPTPNLTRHASAIGTPEFMPPEQWADATTVTPETDIYALGCTLFFLLAGRAPFTGEKLSDVMRGHTSEKPPAISSLRPDAPKLLDAIIAKMLAKDPQQRYRQASEVLDALQRLPKEADAPAVSPRPSSPRRVSTPSPARSRSPFPFVLLSLLALGAGIGTASWWYSKQKTTSPTAQKKALSDQPKGGVALPSPTVKPTTSADADVLKPLPEVTPAPPGPPPVPDPLPAWVARYSLENALEWGDELDIVAFAKRESDGKMPESLSDELKKKFDAETTRRRTSRVDTLMAELLTSLPEESRPAWPDRTELAEYVGSLKSFDSVSSLADLQSVRSSIESESAKLAQPFDGLNLSKAGDDWAKEWAESATNTLQQMMKLHAKPATLTGFEAKFLDPNSQPVEQTPVKVPVTLAYRSPKPIYLTVVQWDEQGLTSIPLTKESAASDRLKSLSTIRFDLPGPKLVILYATDRHYFKGSVDRVDGEPIKLDEVFSSRRIVPRLRRSFEEGKPLAGVAATTDEVQWTRSVLRLDVK